MGCMSRRSVYSKQRERFGSAISRGTQDVGYNCGCLPRGVVMSCLMIRVNKLDGTATSREESVASDTGRKHTGTVHH